MAYEPSAGMVAVARVVRPRDGSQLELENRRGTFPSGFAKELHGLDYAARTELSGLGNTT